MIIVNVMFTHNNCIRALLMASAMPWVDSRKAEAGTSAMALMKLIALHANSNKLSCQELSDTRSGPPEAEHPAPPPP